MRQHCRNVPVRDIRNERNTIFSVAREVDYPSSAFFWAVRDLFKNICGLKDFYIVNPDDEYFAVVVKSVPSGTFTIESYREAKASCGKSNQCALFFGQLDVDRSPSKLSGIRIENLREGTNTIIATPKGSSYTYRYTVSSDNSVQNFGRKDCLPEEFIKAFLGAAATALLIHMLVLLRKKRSTR